jgi:hypothetical protein
MYFIEHNTNILKSYILGQNIFNKKAQIFFVLIFEV